MTMKIAQAAAAYAQAGRIAGLGGAGASDPAGGSFGEMVREAAQDSMASLQKGEQASLQAVTGKADLSEVVTAVSNAEATLQTVAALRDRVVAAYQEIMRMPI